MDRIKRYINSENYSEESNGSNASTSEYCDSDLSDTESEEYSDSDEISNFKFHSTWNIWYHHQKNNQLCRVSRVLCKT